MLQTPPALDRTTVRALLSKYNLHPKRGLGQNFLVDSEVLRSITEAAELCPSDAVLEIGPGLGVLTKELLQRARCVLAVELDGALTQVLREELRDIQGLEVLQADILKIAHGEEVRARCATEAYKVIANLPYYITSHVLRRLLEHPPRPELLVVMVQREVAERAVAAPGEMSLLALSVQLYSEPEIVSVVPRGAFLPPPDVESAVLRMRTRTDPLFPDITPEFFFWVAGAGFGQKRKTLLNSLSSNLKLDKRVVAEALRTASVDPGARAQQLSLEEWAELCRSLSALEQ